MNNINKQLESDMSDFGKKQGGADLFYKFQAGENRVRVLTKGEVLGQHFFGKGIRPTVCYGVSKGCPFHQENNLTNTAKEFPNVSIKYSVYLLDRVDNSIKVADLPYTVIKKIGELQEDADYSFDSFPMPYDLKITYKPDESASNMYSIIASPKREDISAELTEQLKEKMEKYPIDAQIQKKKDAQILVHKEQGVWVSPEAHKASFDARTAQINTGKDSIPTVDITEEDLSHIPYPENNLGTGPDDF